MTTQTNTFHLRLIPEDFDLGELEFLKKEPNSYPLRGIFNNETLVACVEYDEVRDVNQERSLYIEMIEVVQKGEGIGTSIVTFLFEHLRLTEVSGEAVLLSDDSDRPLRFWENLGASFEAYEDEKEDVESDFWESIPIAFTLKKEHLTT